MRDLVPERIRALELPPFDPFNRRAAELRAAGHHVISLGQAVPFFGPPASAVAAARAALDTPDVHHYVTDPGRPALRALLATRLSDLFGNRFDASELLITAGGNQAFALALTTLVDPGAEVILPAPYFTNHEMMVRAHGAIAIEAPVADRSAFAVRWSDIESRLTSRTQAIVLCNPSNPTGAPVDAGEGQQIVQNAAARGLLVISDEAYAQFVYEGAHWSAASAPAWRQNVVVIGTFSKCFGMMGWRLGFVLADAAICNEAVKVQDAMIICAPAIAQIAAEAAVRDDWSHPMTFHDELRARRQVLVAGLSRISGVSWVPQRAGLFAFVRVAGCDDSMALSKRLIEEAHIVTIPGSVFGLSGEGCLRLSYGFAPVAEIREAVERLGTHLPM